VVAVLRLETFVARGANITFAGIDLLGLAIAVPFSVQLRAQRDLWAADSETLGLPLHASGWQPPTLKAHLISRHAEQLNRGAVWRYEVFCAYWRDGAAIDDDDVLFELALNVGLVHTDVATLLADATQQRALTQQMTHNRRRGIGDVPILEVHGNFVSPHLSDNDLAALLMV